MPFSDLPARVAEVRDRIEAAVVRGGHRQGVTIVAVTKTHGADAVRAAWEAGVHDVGENRVQEALGKMGAVDVPVRWHLIGHLQRNKVKDVEPFALVHSLDSPRLADTLCAAGLARGRALDVLVQVNTSGEESKGGYTHDELLGEAERLTTLAGLRVRGVMSMAPLTNDERVLRATFAGARAARQLLADVGHPASDLSMGMSNDYEIAVEEGATMVRLGTVLFGTRSA
jgi:pyridoxal phosphate enzyme (YggS family)